MTHVILFALTFLVLLDSQWVQAQDVENVLSRLERRYQSTRDLYASFTQIVRFGVTGNTQLFAGKLWMRKGNRYRIEMEQQTIVTDGKTVWTFSELNKQVLIDKFRDDANAFTPDKVLVNVPKNYFANIIGNEKVDDGEILILKLVPREKKSLTKSMKVWVNTSEWLMAKVEVLDVSDNQTTYLIKDLKINEGIADNLFHFDIPSDVEVVDLRASQ